MLVLGFFEFDLSDWATWLIIGVGIAVTAVVFVLLSKYRRRRRLALQTENEELPWEKLLEQLCSRHRELASSSAPVDDDLEPEEFLSFLLSRTGGKAGAAVASARPRGRTLTAKGGAERRSHRRRWGNPTEVYLNSPGLGGQMRGLVINRSAPGLAIFVNQEVRPGTTLAVRAVEAPNSVPPVEIEVKYCRKTRRNYVIGCHSAQGFPWNVRGWLG